MATISINSTLTLDQTSGLQVGADGDDVEITLIGGKLEGLPDALRDFLFTLSSTFLTADGQDYADDVEATTSSGTEAFITVDPEGDQVKSLLFSDASGELFDGDQVFLDDGVTAMTTVEGEPIYLHSYSDGTIVLATTSATKDAGEVVTAFYLDVAADSLSAEVTMVTFMAIDHPDSSDSDDSVDFGNILNVSATGTLSFDFDNLSSGNFVHVTVGSTASGLLVSGRDPTADTINTSQGGQGSTIGVNSQMFVPGSSAVFNLVEGQEPGTSTDIAEVSFDDFIDVNDVSIFISQVQGSKSAPITVQISTFSAGGSNTDPENGDFYIYTDGMTGDALGDDDEIAITGVVVLDENGIELDPVAAGVTIDIDPDGTGDTHIVQVSGLHVLWSVQVSTTETFNRFHVESIDGKFDIGRVGISEDGLLGTTPIGDALIVDDDGPSVMANGVIPTLTTDDTDIEDSASASFAGLFTTDFGTDGFKDTNDDDAQDADAVTYALGVKSAGVDSGLVDSLSGDKIFLYLESGVVVGRVGNDDGTANASGAEALTIAVDAGLGSVTLIQKRAVVHNDSADPAETGASAAMFAAADLVTLSATATDGDGDSANASADIGLGFSFEDDGPSINRNAVAVPVVTTDDTDIEDSASASFAGLFTTDFGTDGFKDTNDDDAQDADAVTYALGVKSAGVDSGLVDSLSGDKIFLYLESGVVVGRVGNDDGTANASGAEALTIAVDAGLGSVTLIQKRAVVHNDSADPAETGASAAMLAAADLVTLSATATDGDGDSASASADIGLGFSFEDDGPSISRNAVAAPVVTTDDTDIEDSASASFAGLFTTDFGTDGFKDTDDDDAQDADAVTYALGVKSAGVDSGIDDTETGDDILLRYNAISAEIEGYLANNTGILAFTIGVDANSSGVTLTQKRAVLHDDPADPVESGASTVMFTAADLITLTAIITDGDGDTNTAIADIGNAFAFEDDGPSIGPIDSLEVDYTNGVDGTGSSSLNALTGADIDASFQITGYKGDSLTVFVNGVALTAQLTNDDTKVLYYFDDGAPGDFDGGVEDILYYSYELIDTGDADDVVDTGEFIVHNAPGAGTIEFDLSELPSGQNLFGTLAGKAEGETEVNPDGPTLIVIGRDVVLQPDGTYENTSDTINTSQGGGPTTIGNTNQMIDGAPDDEGIFFAYVVDPNDSYLSAYMDEFTEGLDQSEADDADNIEYFGGTFKVGGAAFEISQTQGNELPSLKISAYDSVGTSTPGSGLQGRDFALDPIAGGTQVEVASVRVFDENGNLIEDSDDLGNFDDPTVMIFLNNAGDELNAVVTGLDAKYTIEFETALVHDISLIEGVDGKFDIGAFRLIEAIPTPDQIFNFDIQITDNDGDPESATHSVRVDGTGIYNDDPLPIGTEGPDTLIGTPGDDELLGLGGDDLLIGFAGFDLLDGGADSDTVDYSASNAAVTIDLDGAASGGHATGDTLISIENLIGSAFADTLTGNGLSNVLIGGGSDDTLNGEAGDDLIEGGDGADDIDGGADNDTASYAGSGAAVDVDLTNAGAQSGGDAAGDTLSDIENLVGSGFADTLTGDNSANVIDGGAGDDTITGNGGADTLNGEGGDDLIEGGAGADDIDGGADDDTASYANAGGSVSASLLAGTGTLGDANGDTFASIENLIGSAFADTLTGDGAANTIDGGAGADTLNGDGGDDLIEGGAGADDIDGGADDDTASYAGSNAAVAVDLGAGTASGGHAAGDALTSIENLTGSAHADTLTGDNSANVIDGGAGADTISGNGGADTLNGEAGNDLIEGGAGADDIDGGADTDTATYASSGAGVDVNLAAGTGSGGDAAGDTLSDIENLVGSGFADTLTGDNSANVIDGGAGDDTIIGNGGADTLNGEGGDDLIEGGAGADDIDGGADDDTASYANAGGSVSASLLAGTGTLGDANGDTFASIENLIGSAFADTLTGDGAANTIDGGAGADTINGSGGADTLNGDGGDDLIEGGAGADDIDGGADDDTASYAGSNAAVAVDLGAGTAFGGHAAGDALTSIENLTGSAHADTLTGDNSANVIDGGAGADTISGNGGADTLNGEAGNDLIEGGAGADDIDGGADTDTATYASSGAGVDVNLAAGTGSGGDAAGDTLSDIENLVGSGFADTLTGDNSANVIDGGAGDDTITGNGGADTLNGEGGDDLIEGGAGADDIDGGADDDTASYANAGGSVSASLLAGTGTLGDANGDTFASIENLIGSAFADTLTGDGAANTIDGGAGADTINGSGGADTLNGDGGDDLIEGGAGADDIDGGADDDTASYAGSNAAVAVDLGAGTASGGHAAGDALTSIESLTGSAHADTLTGDNSANVIDGGAGADTISGNGGADTLNGEAGNDLIEGGAGADDIDGGADTDTATYASSGAGVDVNLAAGTGSCGDAAGDTLSDIENLVGSGFADTLTGDNSANVIDGGAGDDTITGNGGADTLNGEGGDDLIEGGAGADDIDGGADDDTASYANAGGSVSASLLAGTGTLGDANGDTFASIENLIGSAFADTLTGDGAANTIDGGAGADTIDGGADNDAASYAGSGVGVTVDLSIGSAAQTSGGDASGDELTSIENLIGSAFADTLTGDGGANVIRGGAGDDIIAGGADAGFDLLYGGAGADQFVLAAETGLDIIEDFEDGIDMIQVLGLRADEIDIIAYSTTSTELRSIYGDRLVVIRNVDPSLITEDDLILGPPIEPIIGSESADTLIGTTDGEEIYGLGGDDLIEGGEGGDTIDGGADTDTASYAGSGAGVDVDLVSGIGLGGDAEGDTLAGIENLIGSAFTDTLTGDGAANVIDGGAGDDTIYGNGGDDTLNGEGGDDLIEGGSGADDIDGGADIDTASYADAGGSVAVSLLSGTGTLGAANGDTLSEIENLIGSAFADTLTGDGGANVIRGGAGDDIIAGGADGGFDQLYGGAGADQFVLAAETGLDIIEDFEDGIDMIQVLGLRADEIDIIAYSTTSTELRSIYGDRLVVIRNVDPSLITEDDLILGPPDGAIIGTENADTLAGTIEDDVISGLGGDDVITADAGDDLIEGGSGADSIDGGADDDTASYADAGGSVAVSLLSGAGTLGDANGDTLTDIENLIGSAFADTLTGDGGANVIRGGAGDDIIAGGADGGFDLLYGGAGADQFVLAAETGLDIIEDFEDGIDMIEVVGLTPAEIDIIAYSTSSTELRSIYGDRLVVIRNVDPTDITEADLLFT